MPLVHISLLEGRTPELKHRLIEEVAHACSRALDVPLDRVHVALHELTTDEYGVGGVAATIARRNAAPPTSA